MLEKKTLKSLVTTHGHSGLRLEQSFGVIRVIGLEWVKFGLERTFWILCGAEVMTFLFPKKSESYLH